MSSQANPLCQVVLYTPPGGISHPMVQLPPTCPQPFTLLPNPGGTNYYETTFHCQDVSANVRIFAMVYANAPAAPVWTTSIQLAPPPGENKALGFLARQITGAGHLWIGAWWDNGTYGSGDQAQVIQYFTDHPYDPNHHTVPILVGT
jgi:hypothetical protein